MQVSLTALALLAAAFDTTQTAQAHCDSLDGPVVNAVRGALTENNINLVLILVLCGDIGSDAGLSCRKVEGVTGSASLAVRLG